MGRPIETTFTILTFSCVLGCTTNVGGPGFGSAASSGVAEDSGTGESDDGGAEDDGDGSTTFMPGESDGESSASGSDGAADESGSNDDGPDAPPGDPNCAGGCASGQDWSWDGSLDPADYVDGAVLEGPMPPLQGGGSGLDPSGQPVLCYGGNFGDYSDNASFCAYVANRFRYLEVECGNFNTAFLTEDPALGSIAQAEAEAVAGGQCPRGDQSCGGYAEMLYIDGFEGEFLSRDAMYTAPESSMMVGQPLWSNQEGQLFPYHACQFTGEFANVMLYHYCVWEGTNNPIPETQPTRIGCGTAVDTTGVTWRVIQLGE